MWKNLGLQWLCILTGHRHTPTEVIVFDRIPKQTRGTGNGARKILHNLTAYIFLMFMSNLRTPMLDRIMFQSPQRSLSGGQVILERIPLVDVT